MWLLTCDGDLFGGKSIWLRPGSTHLFGRTTGQAEGGERIQYISHKSVSRKHLIIEVDPVRPGNSSKLFVRCEIRLKDGSKIGTSLNGQKFTQETKVLDGKEYTIKLGTYEPLLHLVWRPVILSFTSASKKAKGDALAALREKLEPADIKLINDYVTNETTHAIAKKRNTIAGLQALVQARWLVTDGFADALATAVYHSTQEGMSLLEKDFDANWPNAESYLVPPGNEPHPRDDEYLKPNANRMEVFQEFTFVFLSQSQYESLLPVITSGGGKALLKEVEPGAGAVEEFVEYVKEIAGRKGSGQFRLSQHTGKGGVVVVRLNERDEAWRQLMRGIDLALDQRSVEQNEFLDAILTLDASGLRKQLEEEPSSAPNSVPPSQPAELPQDRHQQQQERIVTVADSPRAVEQEPRRTPQEAAEEQQVEQPATTAKRRNRRIITHSRFKGFDDFDPSQFSRPASGSPEPSVNDEQPSQAPSVQSMDIDDRSQVPRSQIDTRKRPAPVEEEAENEDDMYASILTGHAAMKWRRTEAGQDGESSSRATPLDDTDRAGARKLTKGKKKVKEVDVIAEVQARRQLEEEKYREDEESLRQAGMDITGLKNLAQIEEMELPVRDRRSRTCGNDAVSERWDPAWNGRKNFKKFRPQGQRNDGPRLQRVIVTLEEVPRKGHGIGEEYWISSASTNRSKSKSQSQSQRQGTARSQRTEEDDEDAVRFRRRLQNSREEDQEYAEAEQILPDEIAGQARDEGLQQAALTSTPSQTLRTNSQAKGAGKRPATLQAGGPAKKARQSRPVPPSRELVNLDDDDDDELKFRRRRRG